MGQQRVQGEACRKSGDDDHQRPGSDGSRMVRVGEHSVRLAVSHTETSIGKDATCQGELLRFRCAYEESWL